MIIEIFSMKIEMLSNECTNKVKAVVVIVSNLVFKALIFLI